MTSKLSLLFLALVVLPTAVLSLLAVRVLRNRELVLASRIERDAAAALRETAARLDARLDDDLERVRQSLASAVRAGAGAAELRAEAHRLLRSGDAMRQIYLFMNPWGFIYPEPDRETGEKAARHEALIARMRSEVASAVSLRDPVRFTHAGHAYAFVPLGDRMGIYAGCELDGDALRRRLQSALISASGGAYDVAARGPGIEAFDARNGSREDVVVSDSFSAETRAQEVFDRTPVAALDLKAPFDRVRIEAVLRDPEALRRGETWRKRLYVWGLVLLAGGTLAGAVFVAREAGAEMRRARARGDFMMGVSHDLRTPVASMRMLSESLHQQRISDPQKRREFLGLMVRECDRLNDLIERVLFFIRYGQNALAFRLETLDAGELVRGTGEAFRLRAAGARVDLKISIAKDLPVIRGDETALRQVVLNLLDNAARYGVPPGATEDGEVPVKLDVRKTRRRRRRPWPAREWVHIAVRDRGPGIPADKLKLIFRRYYRLPDSQRRNVSGLGLGLALCRHVARAHGGWMEAESVPGQGSRFSVYLPADQGTT